MPYPTTPNEGLPPLLDTLVRAALVTTENLSARLYANDYTPSTGTTIASFVEASFQGYQRREIARQEWAAPTLVGGKAVIKLTGESLKWTNNGIDPATVYGVYLVGGVTGLVYYARRFPDPVVMAFGVTWLVDPAIALSAPFIA